MGHHRTVLALWVALGLLVAGVLAAGVLAAESATSTFRWPVFALVATAWALLAFFLARCYENLHRLRVAGWTLSPGTVVVGMLLPLVNVFVLFVAVGELWRTSHPWEGGGVGPDSWRKERTGAVPILWGLASGGLWTAGALVAVQFLGGKDPADSIFLFSMVAVLWSVATYGLVSRLAARQVERRSGILSTYRTEAGVSVVRAVYARPRAELELNHAFGVLGFALLALRAIQLLFGFLGLDHPLYPLLAAQTAFLVAGIAIAGLQGVPLGQLLESSPARPRDLAAGSAVGLFFPLLTVPIALAMARYLGLPSGGGEAGTDVLLGFLTVSVLVAPFVEEIIFRGILYQGFDGSLRPGATIFVTSAVFGLAHLHVVQTPVAFFVGLACGYARWKTGSLAAPIAIHLGNNLAVGAMALSGIERPAVLWIALGGVAVASGLAVLGAGAPPLELVARQAAAARDRLRGGPWRLAERMAAGRDLLRWVSDRLPVWIAALRRVEWGSIMVTFGLAIAASRSAAAGIAFLKIAPLGMGRFLAACYYGFVAAALARGQRARAVVLLLPLAWLSLQGAFADPRIWGMRATQPASDTGWRFLSLAVVLAGILVATGFRPWAGVLQWRRQAGGSSDPPSPSH